MTSGGAIIVAPHTVVILPSLSNGFSSKVLSDETEEMLFAH